MNRKIGVAALVVATSIILFVHASCIDNEQQIVYIQQVQPAISVSVPSASVEDISDHMTVVQEEKTDCSSVIDEEEPGTYLGTFRISHYCPCKACNGGWNTTATGNPLTVGTTIAVDKSVIPLNSTVYIDGYGERIAHDTGGAIKGNRIDLLVATHEEAMNLGIVYRDVYLR